MQLLRTTDRPEQKYTLAFVGYGDESHGAVLELTYNYGVDALRPRRRLRPHRDRGATTRRRMRRGARRGRQAAARVTREAGPVKGGTTVIAFVQDPDGYKIELIERSRDR